MLWLGITKSVTSLGGMASAALTVTSIVRALDLTNWNKQSSIFYTRPVIPEGMTKELIISGNRIKA